MWIGLSEADRLFWRRTAEFARKTARPHIHDWERAGQFPRSLWLELGRRGLLGMSFGRGPQSLVRLALALDAFAYGSKDLGIVNSWGVHSAMAGGVIDGWAVESARRRLLPLMASGRCIAAFALTEPNAGSDAAAIETSARWDGRGYVLSGRKAFVTNSTHADVFVVIARDADADERSFSAFVVERGASGLKVGPVMEKTCIRTSPCGEVELRECRVAKQFLLGERGKAFQSIVLPALDLDRCVVWAGRLGRLRSVLEDVTAYAAKRTQFGQPIGRHQAVMFKLAEIRAGLETSETVLSAALHRLSQGQSVRHAAAVARYVLGISTMEAADHAMQTFGGYAFDPRNHVERYHRDARLDGIGGGTTEMQRFIIGRETLGSVDPDGPWMSPFVAPAGFAFNLHASRTRKTSKNRTRRGKTERYKRGVAQQ